MIYEFGEGPLPGAGLREDPAASDPPAPAAEPTPCEASSSAPPSTIHSAGESISSPRAAAAVSPSAGHAAAATTVSADVRAATPPAASTQPVWAAAPQETAHTSTGRPPPSPAAFKFRRGEARTVTELVELCDRYPEEAQAYLFNQHLERWLAASLGEAGLAQDAHEVRRNHSNEPRHGLEIFVRTLCKVAGVHPYPIVTVEPDRLDFGQVAVGASATATVRLQRKGRGIAWGSIMTEPPLPHLAVPTEFSSTESSFEVQLDALKAQPGSYQTSLVVLPARGPRPCQVEVRYQVQPLKVILPDAEQELGAVPLGKTVSVKLPVIMQPATGRLVGSVSVESAVRGWQVAPTALDSATWEQVLLTRRQEITLSLDTADLNAGEEYSAHVRLKTNAGQFSTTVTFTTAVRWDIVAMFTAEWSVLLGGLMFAVRRALTELPPDLQSWVLSVPQKPADEAAWACGMLGAVILTMFGLLIWYAWRRWQT